LEPCHGVILDCLVFAGHFVYRDIFAPVTLTVTDNSVGALRFNPDPKFIAHLVSSKFVAFGDLLNNASVKDLVSPALYDVPSEAMRFVIARRGDQLPNLYLNTPLSSDSNKQCRGKFFL
jgi:hypothetical protein